ncbi:MAG: Glu/Leu/Phe/Val dehydrogenase, partial [Patescibacteria group bacterium]
MNIFESAIARLKTAGEAAAIEPALVARLSTPNRSVHASIPVVMDDGSITIFEGYRTQHNNSRGPYKGGIRFHPQVDEHEVKALAFWMAIKCSVANIPLGGAKGGITVDPKKLSQGELQRLSRGYSRAMYDIIGQDQDIPAPDVNTTGQIMAWMLDEYETIARKKVPGTFTGKPLSLGGSQGREAATGQGGANILQYLSKKKGWTPNQTTVAIQGFGNVGYHAARIIQDLGYRVVAVSDSQSGIYNEQGLDIPSVFQFKNTNKTLRGIPDATEISNEELLALPVTVLIPAALENAINNHNVSSIKAQVVIELANGPITADADSILCQQGVVIVPDVLANAGGVVVSYFEWVQNRAQYYWSESEVNQKLDLLLSVAFETVWDASSQYNTDLRGSAYIVALQRLSEAISMTN